MLRWCLHVCRPDGRQVTLYCHIMVGMLMRTDAVAGLREADEHELHMRVLNALRYDGKESVDGSVVPEAANVQKLLDGLDKLQRGEPADVLKHLYRYQSTLGFSWQGICRCAV